MCQAYENVQQLIQLAVESVSVGFPDARLADPVIHMWDSHYQAVLAGIDAGEISLFTDELATSLASIDCNLLGFRYSYIRDTYDFQIFSRQRAGSAVED